MVGIGLLFLAGTGLAIGLGSLAIVNHLVSPVIPYLYANARIQARSNYLVSEKKLLDLSQVKSLTEFVSNLQDTDYGQELEKAKTLKETHHAIEKTFIRSIQELKKLSPEQLHKIMDAYLMFWETKMLKTIYRSKFSKTEEKLGEKLLLEVGNLNSNLLKHLVEAETIPDLTVVMANTVYGKVFAEKYAFLEDFEIALDNFVLNYFEEVVRNAKIFEGEYVLDIVNTKFDIFNLLVLLKAEVRDAEEKKRFGLLIKNKTPLSERFEKLVYIEGINVEQFVENCKGLKYEAALAKALELYSKDKSLRHFERELYRFYKEYVTKQELNHVQGSYPLFAYLVKKELEQKNLMIVSKGIEAGFEAREIQGMIM